MSPKYIALTIVLMVLVNPSYAKTESEEFLEKVESDLLRLWIARDRAQWVAATYITEDTEIIAASANEAMMEYISSVSDKAVKLLEKERVPELRRKLQKLLVALDLPAPPDPNERAELARLASQMEGQYGKGKYCPERLQGKCLSLVDMTEIMAKSRDYDELLDIWQGWHKVGAEIKPNFQRYVELANKGARSLGFKDLGELWRSRYDMSPEEFVQETERLWKQVKPLYEELHCYVRSKLSEKYGQDKVPENGPIPAHLLGNMWAQEWSNLFDLLAPEPNRVNTIDLEKALKAKGVDSRGMVRYGEAFFTSLGLDPLPETFWKRSMFDKPSDRDVVCHASAWDIDQDEDIRIKMCIQINEEDFITIHHELGHNYYQRAYRKQPPLFRDSANDGFHEALGDLLALSVTPSYLVKIGLLEKEPPDDLNPLMKKALDKIAFLPWGLMVDRYRWDVFSGRIKPEEYNKVWWEMRKHYQGVAPAIKRTEDDFDPGAKYHIPANVPYTRYFLAAILQFQFHRALCRSMGYKGQLHMCSIYGNKEVGKRLLAMMEMGASRPWPEALKVLTGEERMDATAILEYFEPLYKWLKQKNKGRKCGW